MKKDHETSTSNTTSNIANDVTVRQVRQTTGTMTRVEWLLLVVLFVVALIPRLCFVMYGLPYASVWDEYATYPIALGMLARGDLNPADAPYPGLGGVIWGRICVYGDLLAYIVAAAQAAAFWLANMFGRNLQMEWFVAPPPGARYITWATSYDGLPVLAPRVALAAVNSTVGIFVFVAQRLLGVPRSFAFCGGLVIAIFSPSMIYNSAIIMPDALVATILSVILCLFWKTMKEGKFSWRHRVLMGLLTGCIFSVKLTYPCILILPIAAVLLLEERARWVLRSLQIGALMLLGYLATSPFKIADWQHHWPAFLDAVGIMAGYVPPESTGNYYWENLLTHFETMFLKSTKFEYPAGAISTGFGVGVGWAAGLLALMGMFCLLKDHPRCAVPVLLLAACQGVLVLRPWVPYPRYTLFLIPLIAISCGLGLDLMRRILQTCIAKVSTLRPGGPSQGGSSGRQSGLIPAAVCIAFLALSGGRISSTARHAWSVATYRPPQVQAERFLVSTMRPGDKLGIFDFFPWVHDNLRESGIDFERIGVDQSLAELQRRGITHVAGTDRFVSQRMFPPLKVLSLEGSFWPEYLGNSDVKIAEFGSSPIGNRACYPLVDVYLFVVRLPAEASGPVATGFRAQET